MFTANKAKKILCIVLAVFAALSLAACVESVKQTVIPADNAGKLAVHFIDVGQGDSEFIEFPDGQTMLIDASEKEYGDDVVEYITALGHTKIDYIVATHPHSDHIGGLSYVIANLDVGAVYMPNAVHDSTAFEKLLNIIDEKGIELTFVSAGMQISDKATVLSPPEDAEYDNLNEMSCVLELVYGDTSFLFTGDAGKIAEADMEGDLSADVLKVGHHGSTSATSEAFLNKVKPEYAVISCGKNNDYGHPHAETVELLNEYGIKTFATYAQGTITAVSNGKSIKFDCEPIALVPGAVLGEDVQTGDSGVQSDVTQAQDDDKEAAESAEKAQADATKATQNDAAPYVGNKNSKKFHYSWCDSVEKTADKNKVYFDTAKEATEQGYTPCKSCQPE